MPRGIVTEDPQCIALGWPPRYPGLVNVPFITGPQSFRESILFINIFTLTIIIKKIPIGNTAMTANYLHFP